jgi:hypothetical protein
MTVDTSFFQAGVVFAASGAFGVKLLELAEVRNIPKDQRPDLKELIYWIPFFVLPALGAGLAYMYIMSDIALKPILAVNVGVSAPLILRTMASLPASLSRIDPGKGA